MKTKLTTEAKLRKQVKELKAQLEEVTTRRDYWYDQCHEKDSELMVLNHAAEERRTVAMQKESDLMRELRLDQGRLLEIIRWQINPETAIPIQNQQRDMY